MLANHVPWGEPAAHDAGGWYAGGPTYLSAAARPETKPGGGPAFRGRIFFPQPRAPMGDPDPTDSGTVITRAAIPAFHLEGKAAREKVVTKSWFVFRAFFRGYTQPIGGANG
jgi:hypothetical protein